MRIFIADDDLLIIKGLRKHVASLGAEFSVVGDAQNGAQALDMIAELQPDLLISDVKMPVMGGVELMKTLRERGCDIPILMLSGFNDYQYLRDSIKYSAIDYLLKPIDLVEFDIILRVQADKQRQLAQQKDESGRRGRNRRNERVLERYMESCTGTLALESFEACDSYLSAVFSLDERPKMHSMDYEADVLENNLTRQLLDEFFDDSLPCAVCNMAGDLAVFLGATQDPDAFRASANQTLGRLREILVDYSRLPVTCAAGAVFRDKNEVGANIATVRGLLIQRFYRGGDRMILWEDSDQYSQALDREAFHKLVRAVTEKIIFSELPALKKHVDDIFNFLVASRIHPTAFQRALLDLLSAIYEAAPRMREICIDANYDDCLQAVMNSSSTLRTMRPAFISLFLEKAVEYRVQCNSCNNQFIEIAKKYVRDNYAQQIGLKEVSESVHLNYSYLSELFKEKTGMNFSEYLTKIRMREAKRLLADPSVKIYEISDCVGYQNSASFTRAFKKYTGLSPADYRNIIN